MKTITITKLDMSTAVACSVFLFGGFECLVKEDGTEYKKQRMPQMCFRNPMSDALKEICAKAEYEHDTRCKEKCENLIIRLLAVNDTMTFEGTHYTFSITDFTDRRAMRYMLNELYAQVNDD